MVAKKTVAVPTHMTPQQLSVFYPEFSEALDAWYTDSYGDESEWDEDDSFSIDDDGVLVVEPAIPQDHWLYHAESNRWVQCDDDEAPVLFPGKEI